MVKAHEAYFPLIRFFSLHLPHPQRQQILASCMEAMLRDG